MLDPLVQILATVILSVGGSWAIVYFVARRGVKYMDSYLDAKAKNLATHEDIVKLVDQVRETEKVKAEITDNVWDRQQRWVYKQQVYRELLQSLIAAHHTGIHLRSATRNNRSSVQIHDEMIERVKALSAVVTIAGTAVNEESFCILRKILACNFKDSEVAVERTREAIEELVDSARNDLGYLPIPSVANEQS